MSTTLPDAEIVHPAWCSPALCESDGDGTAHISAPVTWRMQGEDVEVTMRRRQTGLDGEVLIELRLVNDAFPDEPTTLLWTERDVDRLVTGVHELRLRG